MTIQIWFKNFKCLYQNQISTIHFVPDGECKPIENLIEINWLYGSLILNNEANLAYIQPTRKGIVVPVDWFSVGQYTGLKDKNHNDIYEGDIVTADEEDGLDQVLFKNGAFYIET